MKYLIMSLGSALLLALTACGRSLPPAPPEAFSPQPVSELQAFAETDGIRLRWRSPEYDRRGKELQSLDGYKIYRKTIEHLSDVENSDIEFEVVGTVPDNHVEELIKLREQAEAMKKPVHRVRIDEARMKFEFLDSTAVAGKRYFYLVTPYNQGSVDGMVKEAVRVLFRGQSSDLAIVQYIPLDGSSDPFSAERSTLSYIEGRY